MQKSFSIDNPPYGNSERMIEWTQMFLERVDVKVNTLVTLINKVYEDGIKEGRDAESCDNLPCLPQFEE